MSRLEPNDEILYAIVHRSTGAVQGSYQRDYGQAFYFRSAGEARSQRFDMEYQDDDKYEVKKYRVTLEEVE